MALSISFSFCSQFSIIQQISRVDYRVLVLMSFTEGSLADEQLDAFSNVVTNSGGAAIGGSCGTGGFFLLCVLIYLLYRLLLIDDRSVHPTTGPDTPPKEATLNTNQDGASCPHCGPPPPYNQVAAMGECVDLCT